jgi:hypothetical protein
MYPTLFNMEYTDAQKSKDIQPFNDFESLDFLKRKFRFDDDIGDWVACLLEKSRAKGLSIRVRGAATEMEGHQSSLMSSSNEAWKAGREHYDKHFEMMKDIVSKHFTPGFYYPKTFNEYVEAWRERNASINSQPIIGYNSCYRSGRCNMVKHVEVDAVDYGTPLACAGDSDSVKEIVEEVAEITSTVETPMETRSRPSGLENWFDRPIVVLDSELSKKDLLRVPVWEKFFKNGMHAPKITNFKSLRASLHVRVEVTSSPFVAGRLFVAFLPFERGPRVSSLIPQPNHNISREDEWLATLRKVLQVDHLELDYSTSMNGHLEIPLMLDSDYVPIDKLEDLGTLVILSTYPISCSADQANPTVKCSAWAVDVDLVQKAPSATVANLLAQPATSKLNGLQGDGFRYTFEVETLEGLAKIGNITPIRKGDAKEFWESLESLPCDYPIDKLRKMCQDANFEILMLSRDQGVSALIRGYGGKLEEHIASNFTTAIPTAEEAGLASTVSHMESATVSSGFPMNSSRMAAWAEFHKIFENHIRVGRDTQVARSEETQDLKSILDLQLRDATGNMKTKTYNVAAGFAEKTGTTWTDAASGVTPRSLTGKRKKGAKAVALSSVSVVNTKTDILSLCQTEGLEGVYTFKNYQDFDVSPTGKTPLTSGDGKSLFQFSYLGLFDEISTYWVGEIVFRFRFLKTAYHRGKVVLWFDPSSPYGTSTSPPNMEYNACSHVVIDLSEHHEFDIVIPYPKTKWSNTGSSVGRLCMREYAPLRTPLPQISMEYIVTKRAGSSFTFAKPRPLSNQVWGGAFRASSAPLHGGAQYRLKIEDANMAGAKTKSKESPNSELDSRFAKVKETIPTRPVKATVGEPRAVKARFVLGEPIKQDLVGMQAVLRTIDDFINSPQTEYSGLVDTGDLSRNLSLIHPVLPALNPRALSSVGVQRGRHLSDAFANSSSAKEKFFPTYMALFASCYYGYKGAVSRVIRFNPNTPSQGSHLYVTPYNITNKTSRLNVVADDDEIDGMSSTILSQGSASQAISFQSLDFHDTHFHNTTPNEELGVNGFQLVVNSFATETSFTHMVSKGDGFEYCLSRYAPILVVAEISGASASGRGARA